MKRYRTETVASTSVESLANARASQGWQVVSVWQAGLGQFDTTVAVLFERIPQEQETVPNA